MQQIRIKAVGDNLIHKELYHAAEYEKGRYNFDEMFVNIQGALADADVAVINQETILVNDASRISSFPKFGSPSELGDAIVKAGFNVVTHASNHALDKGVKAIKDTVSFWREKYPGITYVGIHGSEKDQSTVRVLEKNGIRVALLNYTKSLNFQRVPREYPYCVDLMRRNRKKQIKEDIKRAKGKAEFVIVFPHWGCEYLYEPVKSQRAWASFFAESGADLIIGTHPHVVQTVETIAASDGRKVPCLYSLGNFISCQIKQGTMLGGMADIVLERTNGKPTVTKVQILPLVTHTDKNYSYFTAYPLKDYSDKLASENKIFHVVKRIYNIDVDCNYLNRLFNDILAQRAQEYNEFKKPADVTWSNIKGVFNALAGKNIKK